MRERRPDGDGDTTWTEIAPGQAGVPFRVEDDAANARLAPDGSRLLVADGSEGTATRRVAGRAAGYVVVGLPWPGIVGAWLLLG